MFDRFGRETVLRCFDALLDKCERTIRDELLSKIEDGTYAWEDYIRATA